MNTDEAPQIPPESDDPSSLEIEGQLAESTAEAETEHPDFEQAAAPDDSDVISESSSAAEYTEDSLPEDEPFAQAYYAEQQSSDDFLGSEVDVDAALAAVASLSDVEAQREAADDAIRAATRQDQSGAPRFLPPEAITLGRRSLASVVPAVILIVSGVLLTFATTSGATISPMWIALGSVGAVALLLLGYWLSARRWARGVFFFAATLLLGSAAVYMMTTQPAIGAAGTPLLISTTGLALALTAILTRPPMRALLLPAIVLILAGAAALSVTLGMVNVTLLADAAQYAWVIAVLLAIIWLLPLVFRRRG
jgi:hypothetical protein